ncbi:MAG: AraC family transcriptional regulator [Gemmatimonadota bacterium]
MARELGCDSGFGRTVRRRVAGSISLFESEFPPDTEIPSHYHPDATICLVLEGGYHERFPGTSFLCGPGTLVVKVAGEVHTDLFTRDGARCFSVSLSGATLEHWVTVADAPDLSPSRQCAPSRFAFELYGRFRAGAADLAAEAEELTLALLDDLADRSSVSSTGRPPLWLGSVRERVHEEFTSVPALEELARSAGVHRVHLAREFRRHFGCTVGQYARRRRLEFACTRLRAGEVDLSCTAIAAGYADQAHMTRDFRRGLRMTPGQFRSRFRWTG